MRDVYADGDDLILVASDRVSVYDVVLPTTIPDKGEVLTRLSLWWFEHLADVMPNHVISATDVPEQWVGRAIRCQRLDMVKVECIARGYLAGDRYQKLDEPIFTPTTKAGHGHDEPMTFAEVADQEGLSHADELQARTLEIYERAVTIALKRGIVVADTKLEFGRTPDGTLVLGDELLTPDSSRLWDSVTWEPLNKQIVRDWATSTGWDRAPPGPSIPSNLVNHIRECYIKAYEMLTGLTW